MRAANALGAGPSMRTRSERPQPSESRPVTDRRRQTTWSWTVDRLSRAQPGRRRATARHRTTREGTRVAWVTLMLDHVTIGVGNIERSKAFYDKALKAIGIERLYAEASPTQNVSRREARATQQSLKSPPLGYARCRRRRYGGPVRRLLARSRRRCGSSKLTLKKASKPRNWTALVVTGTVQVK